MFQDRFQNEERTLVQCLELLSAYGVPMPEEKLILSTAAFLLLPEDLPVSKLPSDHMDIVVWHVRAVHAWCWQSAIVLDNIHNLPAEVTQAYREVGNGMLLSTFIPVRDYCFSYPLDPTDQMTPEQIEETIIRDNQPGVFEKCFISLSISELMHFTKYVWELKDPDRKYLLAKMLGSYWYQITL